MARDEQPLFDWLLVHVKFFRGLGFYPESQGLSDEELAVMLRNFIKTQYHDQKLSFSIKDDLADQLVMRHDYHNLWWEGGEIDIERGDNVYVDTVQGWSRISRRYFVPEGLTEIWHADKGPIEIRFRIRDKEYVLHPKSEDYLGWIDFSILDNINAIVKHSGYQYKELFTDDETTCIIFLTPEQEEKLRRERKWKFVGDPEVERRVKKEMQEFKKDVHKILGRLEAVKVDEDR